MQLGLQFQNKPGWKIYWRSPGDAGLPPQIDWGASSNLAGADIAWPAPHRFSYTGLETIGYEDEIVLPIAARLTKPGEPLALSAKLDYLICAEICVPRHADLALTLGNGPADPTPFAHLISRFLARVPGPGALQGMALLSANATTADTLQVTVSADPPLKAPDIFIERADGLAFAAPQVKLESGGTKAVFTLKAEPNTGQNGLIGGGPLTLTVVDGDRGMEVTTPVAAGGNAATAGAPSLFAMLGIALLGGLILNLMPCVLPVLSLKLLAMAGHGGEASRKIRINFLASAAGILVSFLALAAAAIGAREAGMAIGWGIQFQQPLFLAAMVALVTLFSANLFGFYEIPLPHWLVPDRVTHHEMRGHVGHFFQGAFATLLATPCSAPFLGTAVGFALARGAIEIVAIFAALGIGMALPYLAVTVWPGLVRHMPRPGRWMIVLKSILGVALIATAGWLLFVMATEAGARAAWIVAALMIAALLVLGVGRRVAAPLRVAAVVVLVIAAAAAVTVWTSVPSEARVADAVTAGKWQPFDRAGIDQAVASGKVVVVDVTADWCLTCKLNKRAVLDRAPVADHLMAPNVVAMLADWTRPDDGIAAYLASFDRYGIPFNAVYGPGAPKGIALPELLTDEAVLDALARASKPAS
ncbi:MAG TPA: protein-disulfide reductase DsbD domain-containing protein [Magnetospirillaceae bacterium]